MVAHKLHSIANAEHRDAKRIDAVEARTRIIIVNAVRAARKNDAGEAAADDGIDR